MNNFLKTASQELESNDILKTASILRRLKNKFLNLFDSKRREEVDKLLNKTQSVKPLLGNTYKKIKEIESSINDLDVESYDRNISELKELVSKLNTEMSTLEGAAEILAEEEVKTESKAKAPAHRVGGAKKGNRDRANIPEGYISKYYEKDGVKLKTLQEVGANLGIDMKFGVNILQTQDFLKPFFAGMARIMFVGNMPLRDPSGPPKA
ncbi:MAG TPA: hypothetical protein VMV86_06010, partial [Methanosarcinales archaeon]|nr:hypothetical protein [Methanosarcinales archaeon]